MRRSSKFTIFSAIRQISKSFKGMILYHGIMSTDYSKNTNSCYILAVVMCIQTHTHRHTHIEHIVCSIYIHAFIYIHTVLYISIYIYLQYVYIFAKKVELICSHQEKKDKYMR